MRQPSASLRNELAPYLDRVLVVEPFASSADLAFEMLRCLGSRRIEVVTNSGRAFRSLGPLGPELIVTECDGPAVDGVLFTRSLRRSRLACRQSPLIMLSAEPLPATIAPARDAGAHEFPRKPYSAEELWARVQTRSPARGTGSRPWNTSGRTAAGSTAAISWGRANASPTWAATCANVRDRVSQAVKILKAAAVYKGHDRPQVARAVSSQFCDLEAIAMQISDERFAIRSGL